MRRGLKAKTVAVLASTLLLAFANSADAGMWMGMGGGMWGMGHHHRGYHGSRYHPGYYGYQGSRGSWGGPSFSWSSCGSYGGYAYRVYRIYRPHGSFPNSIYGNPRRAYPAYSRSVVAKPRPVEKSKLAVNVPADATVFVNGRRTDSTGTQREFELHTRKSRHSYRIRAVVDNDERELTQTKLAVLSAGRSAEISFDFRSPIVSNAQRESTNQQSAQKSRLIVKVPENATVFVNGRPTKSTGALREFELQTRRTVHSYRVRAVVSKNELALSETKLVVLSPGGSAKMSFDFDSDVAFNPEPASEPTVPVHVIKKLAAAARDGLNTQTAASTAAMRESPADVSRAKLKD